MNRFSRSSAILTAVVLPLPSATATAQQFPAKPVRFIIGASSEVLPRNVPQRLSQTWGHQLLVDPRPGGGGIVAAGAVMKSPPDGHPWLLSTTTFTISASLLANPPFDLVHVPCAGVTMSC